jgi:hypothetical protein
MFGGGGGDLPDPDPLIRDTDPDPALYPDPPPLMGANPLQGHLKRWALKIETFLGPEMAATRNSCT